MSRSGAKGTDAGSSGHVGSYGATTSFRCTSVQSIPTVGLPGHGSTVVDPGSAQALPGDVAQLARAPALQAGGRGFDSHRLHLRKPRSEATNRPLTQEGSCRRSHPGRSLLADWLRRGDAMAKKPSVRWNESKQRWMAWVRFPDGSRRKVERVEKADAQSDLDELLALRAQEQSPEPRRTKQLTFDQVLDDWFEAGCPNVAPTRNSRHARQKSPNTIANARQLLGTSVRPVIGHQWVDRTTTERLEELFQDMAANGSTPRARSTGRGTTSTRRASTPSGPGGSRPTRRPMSCCRRAARRSLRKSLTLEQAEKLITKGIPEDPRPAMWLTGLMCGLRPRRARRSSVAVRRHRLR